jgi:hypothetical protein
MSWYSDLQDSDGGGSSDMLGAYGDSSSLYESVPSANAFPGSVHEPSLPPSPQPPPPSLPQPQHQQQPQHRILSQQQSQQMQPQIPMMFTPSPTLNQATPTQQVVLPALRSRNDIGSIELMWQRRRDAAKLALMALVILLAIAIHSAAWFYIKDFIEMYPSLTYWKEMGVRVAYPLGVFLLMWYVKIMLR